MTASVSVVLRAARRSGRQPRRGDGLD